MIATGAERRQIRTSLLTTLMVLIVQFLLGIAVNLFVVVPKDHPGANAPEYFSGVVQSVTWAILHGPLLLVLHAVLGLVLVLVAAGLVVRVIRLRSKGLTWSAAIGATAILGAGFNGGSYLNYHEDFSSMIMASFFAIAMAAFITGLFLAGQPADRASG